MSKSKKGQEPEGAPSSCPSPGLEGLSEDTADGGYNRLQVETTVDREQDQAGLHFVLDNRKVQAL